MNVEPNPSSDKEIVEWGNKLERLAQAAVKREIAKHKAAGHPIFYSKNGVPIMELADGRCFEYRLLENGKREIVREIPQ